MKEELRLKGEKKMKKGYLLALSSLCLCGGILATTGSADAAVKWGDYHKDGHYVTIMKKGYGFYKDKDFKKKATTSDKLYHKTYLAKGYYNLSDGRRYMSLYDHNKKWVGYVRSSAVKTAKTAGGIAFNTDKKVKVTKKDYRIWKDLNFKQKKGTTNSYYKKTLYVKPHYNHFNQNVYYSLYTKENGKWIGYVNKNAVSAVKTSKPSSNPQDSLDANEVNKQFQQTITNSGWKGQWVSNNDGYWETMDNNMGKATSVTWKGDKNPNKTLGQGSANAAIKEFKENGDDINNYKYGYSHTTVIKGETDSQSDTKYYVWN